MNSLTFFVNEARFSSRMYRENEPMMIPRLREIVVMHGTRFYVDQVTYLYGESNQVDVSVRLVINER